MMKTKKIVKKRVISAIVALALCFNAVAASAAVYSSDYFSIATAHVEAISAHRIKVSLSITAAGLMSKLGASQIDILESTNGGASWRTVKSYTPEEIPAMMSSGSKYFEAPVIFAGIAGREYKALITCYAENSTGSSSRVCKTNSVTAVR